MKMAHVIRTFGGKNTLLLVLLLSLTDFGMSHELDMPDMPDMSDWVNPDDIFFQEDKSEMPNIPPQEQNTENEEFTEQEVPKQNHESNSDLENPHCDTKDVRYLNRFVNILLKALYLDHTNDNLNIHETKPFKLSVTKEQLHTLRNFGDGGKHVTLSELDETLTSVFKTSSDIPKCSETLPSLIQMYSSITNALSTHIHFILPWVWFVGMVFTGQSTYRGLISAFPIFIMSSYFSTWVHLRKQAEVEQYIEARKHKHISPDCDPRERKVWWFFTEDNECQAFLKSELQDPYSKITASHVMSVLLSDMWVVQLSSLGSGLSQFFSHLGQLPYLTQLFVIPLCVFILLYLASNALAAMFGGTIRLPMFLGSVSFDRSTHHQRVEETSARSQSGNISSPAIQPIQFHITVNQPPGAGHAIRSDTVPQFTVPSICNSTSTHLRDVNNQKRIKFRSSSADTLSKFTEKSLATEESPQDFPGQTSPQTTKKRKVQKLGYPLGANIPRFAAAAAAAAAGGGDTGHVFHFKAKEGSETSASVNTSGAGDSSGEKCHKVKTNEL